MSDGIILQNPSRFPVNAESLNRACRAVLDCHPEKKDCSLSIVLTDAKTIRAMNLRFAQVEAPTDVLSFSADSAPLNPEQSGCYLGDIVIAHDYASAQARSVGAAIGDVHCLLVIHGTLHLLGYDHDTAAARDRMWAAQEVALLAANINPELAGRYGNIGDD